MKINRNNLCPCGSEIKAKKCCYKNNKWFKEPSNTKPLLSATGFSNSKCYASSLLDCNDGITKEHYVSKNLLKYIGEMIHISGYKNTETKDISVNSLTARILCERHNNILSGLDTEAGRFFKALKDINNPDMDENLFSNLKDIYIFSGEDIEKWCLKLLCGLISAGISKTPTRPRKEREIDPLWVSILFGTSKFPYNWGLYDIKNDRPPSNQQGLFAEVINKDNDSPDIGFLLGFAGIQFGLSLGLVPGNSNLYHPNQYVFRMGKIEKKVVLTWKEERQNIIVCKLMKRL